MEISNIKLEENDKLIFTIPIGNLPQSKADEYLAAQKELIMAVFPEKKDNVLLLPSRTETRIQLTVITP